MPNKKNFIKNTRKKVRRSAPESELYEGAYKASREMNEAEVGGGFAFDAVVPKRAPRATPVEKAPRAIAVKKAASTVKKKKAKSGYNN